MVTKIILLVGTAVYVLISSCSPKKMSSPGNGKKVCVLFFLDSFDADTINILCDNRKKSFDTIVTSRVSTGEALIKEFSCSSLEVKINKDTLFTLTPYFDRWNCFLFKKDSVGYYLVVAKDTSIISL